MSEVIKYISSRGMETNLCFEDVLLNGLAKAGGLYIPEKWPEFSYKELLEMQGLDYISLAEKIMLPFVGSNLKQKIGKISKKVYEKLKKLAEGAGLCLFTPKQRSSSVFLTSLRLSPGTFSSILCSIGGWICESTLVHLRPLWTT